MIAKRKPPHYMTVLAHGARYLSRIDPDDPMTARSFLVRSPSGRDYIKTFTRGLTRIVVLPHGEYRAYYDRQGRLRFRDVPL